MCCPGSPERCCLQPCLQFLPLQRCRRIRPRVKPHPRPAHPRPRPNPRQRRYPSYWARLPVLRCCPQPPPARRRRPSNSPRRRPRRPRTTAPSTETDACRIFPAPRRPIRQPYRRGRADLPSAFEIGALFALRGRCRQRAQKSPPRTFHSRTRRPRNLAWSSTAGKARQTRCALSRSCSPSRS